MAYIVALDKKTGEEKWRADRPNRTRSYCTPILIQSAKHPDVTQLVLSGSKCVTGYNADTGKLLLDHQRADGAVRRQPRLPGRHAVPDDAAFRSIT